MNSQAIIIGSGLAGLASAIRLAQKGYAVQVFEANACPGGKVTEITGKGYRFDAGPSLFTMPHLVDELFRECGKDPEEHFPYYRKQVACRYFWDDGTALTAHAEPEAFAREAEQVLGVPAQRVKDYLARSAEIFDTTHRLFLEKSLHRWQTYFSTDIIHALGKIHKLHLLETLHGVNHRKLQHPHLVQLFDRFATYNGSSPYRTPGIMSIIPHLEHNTGTFFPRGGMHRIALSLFELAQEQGVIFHFSDPVERILTLDKQATGVRTLSGEYRAEVIMCNADIVPAYRKLMPGHKAPEKILNQPRSSSALIFYWGIKKQFPQLDLHNIFFSSNYREEFAHIFESGTVSDDPTIYINISAKEEPGDAPGECENWFVMINVPPDNGQDWDHLIPVVRRHVLQKLSRALQVPLETLIEYEAVMDPRDIEQKTGSYQGALYGAASNNRMAAFLRHPNFSSNVKGLYFCGGSVHPGGGIPLSLLSAKIACEGVKRNKAPDST